MERREAGPGVVRPELDEAMAAAGEAAIKVLLVPSVDSRRVIEGTLPLVSDPGMKVPANSITKGFQWGAIGIDLPPQMTVECQIRSADAASAKMLMELWNSVTSFVGRAPELKELQPSLNATLDMIKPEVAGAGLRLSLDEGQCRRLVTDLLVPPLAKVRGEAQRIRCATNLSSLGKALLIYANDHADEFPSNLDALVEKVEVSPQSLICDGKRYIYRGDDLPNTSVEPSLVMAHDRAGNHKGGRNVLFVDTHVEWVTEERFQKLIEEDNAMRRKAGLPEKPAQ